MLPPSEAAPNPRFSRSELSVVTTVVIVLLTVVFALSVPSEADADMIDHALFTKTVERMVNGLGYYEAMEASFDEVYGPERAAVTESVRAFRPPLPFLVWRVLGAEHSIWLLFLVCAAASGVLASRLAANPLSGVLVTAYVLTLGMFLEGGLWTAQFTTSELWALPFMFGAAVSVTRDRWWLAASLALVATSIRETAATLILAGAALSIPGRTPRSPWLVAAAMGAGLYALHAVMASSFIDPGRADALPSPAQFPSSFLAIVGFGLPSGAVLGLVLWIAAIAHVVRRIEHGLLLSAFLWLPLVGFVLDRPYWGVMVVPFALVWGFDELALFVRQGFRRALRWRAGLSGA